MGEKLKEELMKTLIPDLKLDEQQRVSVETIDVPLLINGKDAKVTIRKLSTGVRNRIRSESAKTKVLAGQPVITVDDTEIQEKILFACIEKAPFDKTMNGIKDLPAEVSDYLFEKYMEFTEPTLKKKD